MKRLYFGDNLDMLREHIPSESVDLIYLDPPFNSSRAFNVFFQSPKGETSQAQVTAFNDTWSWSDQSERDLDEIINSKYIPVADLMRAFKITMPKTNMLAYLVMMTNRLIEMHRVLKPTGNLFLHCDSTANSYLRVILDALFDPTNFRNEITWKRTSSHNDARRKLGMVTDRILFYGKSPDSKFNTIRTGLNPEYVKQFYHHADPDGRRFRLSDMASPNPRPNLMYEWMGYKPPKKGWRYSQETMQQLHDNGLIFYPPDKTQRLAKKKYLDENEGQVLHDVWDDIRPLQSQSKEYMGYPTQKPQKLLERIIELGSDKGDVVLDPFCGCGTAVHAAEALGRQWMGIDITHWAITLIERRLESAFPSIEYEVEGSPKDLASAQDLFNRDPFQFEWWACSLVKAQPAQQKKKGSDKGVDGVIYFTDNIPSEMTHKIIVSIKGGQRIGVAQVRDLVGAMQSHNSPISLFVTLHPPTKDMIKEAAMQGFYEAGNGIKYPKVQILTIQELMLGHKRPEFYDLRSGQDTFKKSPVEKPRVDQNKLI